MEIKGIMSIEQTRTDKRQFLTVHLLKERGFYHAYEWSAWLYVNYIERLEIINRRIKKLKSDYVMVGFPIGKYSNHTADELIAVLYENCN